MLTKEMAAVVLAGGRSSRMGTNKLLLPLGDDTVVGTLITTLTGMFAQCVVVTDHPEEYQKMPVRITEDLIACKVKNSLVGIHAGLTVSRYHHNLVVAGDMPFVKPELLTYLCGQSAGYDVIIPRQGGHCQPLCAIYHKNCIPLIEKLLEREHYKILDFFPPARVCYVDVDQLLLYDPELLSFFNVNTLEDYEKAQDIVKKRRAEAG